MISCSGCGTRLSASRVKQCRACYLAVRTSGRNRCDDCGIALARRTAARCKPCEITRVGSAADRFWRKVQGGDVLTCWNWQGSRDRKGYGRFGITARETRFAHRWAYQQLIGEIPDGLVLDHLCRNPSCVNPWHLQPVTIAVNVQRAYQPVA